ncbi:uncharacterized protein TNCT_420751 [Trichonephila clavata]|uniref:Uncharacterized protein n=1 Tax=Trichonephila clavata TaxID=2740835 RepID=A0A8X6H884_TRICU|nr:uncharacterized protein TNCT_420751 [Trichonephila clavata]
MVSSFTCWRFIRHIVSRILCGLRLFLLGSSIFSVYINTFCAKPVSRNKMALSYIVSLLLVLQIIAAAPTETTEETIPSDITIFSNETLLDNSTEMTTLPPQNFTSDNETADLIVNMDVSESTDAASNETVVETVPYEPETEGTTVEPPPAKKISNIENVAFLIQPSMLAVILPICVKLLTSWNKYL